MTTQSFIEQLPFPLDPFQKEAIQEIEAGHSVVVCAPTGSGKTIIAEAAASFALEQGKKLFYTTPLKALSNQKYHDLKQQFGEANVGLLTGDISINRDARIIVMTTEIFRNMLYGIREESRLLSHIGYVVLDECHFMNDAERGTVWEESIIYCPEHIQIIALSATVANAQELTDWINEVHHDTRLIWSDFRPVPLRFSFYDRDLLLPLFDTTGRMNKKLKLEQKGNRFDKKRRFFRPNQLIELMQAKDMLPAIFFTFSRKDCDKHLEFTQALRLLTPDERKRLNHKIDDYLQQHPFLADSALLPYIRNGFASHHAGLLPALKHLVEQLFQQGLIKVVFATETLAAGINMPARSTVITKISKRTNDGHRILTASEFLQMSGRAGRRGMDEVGYVIIVSSPYEGAREAAMLASSPPDPLNSQFTPTYGMVLNLLQTHTLQEAEFLIRQSFGQFTSDRRLQPMQQMVGIAEQELAQAINFQCPVHVSDADFHAFEKSKVLMHDTGRFVRILQKQLKQHGDSREIQKQLSHEQAKMENLRGTVYGSPCYDCKVLKKHQRAEEQIRRLQKKLKALNHQQAAEHDTYWRQFMNIYALLKEVGYLGADDKPTPSGNLTAQIRSENEYALSEVVTAQNLLLELEAPQLAGVLSALVNDSNRDNQYTRYSTSPQSDEAFGKVDRLFRSVEKLQRKHHVNVPMVLNPIASGLVEAWAHGVAWDRLIASTNIGEGDIVRMMRRTADILRQIGRIPEIPTPLAQKAKEALKLIYREPIKDIELSEEDLAEAAEKAGILDLNSLGLTPEAVELEVLAAETDNEGPVKNPVKPSSTPDWKPLGTVRDYFSEQIKQDEQRF